MAALCEEAGWLKPLFIPPNLYRIKKPKKLRRDNEHEPLTFEAAVAVLEPVVAAKRAEKKAREEAKAKKKAEAAAKKAAKKKARG